MSVGHRDLKVIMRTVILAVLLTGCTSFPMNGELLEAVRDDSDPVSCQCNVHCGA